MSRTEAALKAVTEELSRRRGLIDATEDLDSLTIMVKFQSGPMVVRAVRYEDQRIVARRMLRST